MTEAPTTTPKKRGRPRKEPESSDSPAPKPKEPAELQYETCAELYRIIETDPDASYHVGVHRAAPFDSVSILGVSLEFQISHWDSELRTNNFQEGRIIEIPTRLAEEIEKKARATYYWCKIVYGVSGEQRGFVKQGEVNATDPVDAKRLKDRPNKRDPRTGQVTHEYRCLWDWLILRKCEGNSMRPNDSLLAENAQLSRQIEEMRQRLREVN